MWGVILGVLGIVVPLVILARQVRSLQARVDELEERIDDLSGGSNSEYGYDGDADDDRRQR